MSVDPTVVDALVASLGDRVNVRPASDFPWDRAALDHPGLYSWWADDEGRAVLGAPFGVVLPPLIYAGQAGASSKLAGLERGATLLSRIGGNHLGGNIGSSTFRKTLTAVLLEALNLTTVNEKRIGAASNVIVTGWMRAHLSLVIARCDDRATLAHVEDAVLARLDPPLNLQGMTSTPIRRQLKELRKALSLPSVAPAN